VAVCERQLSQVTVAWKLLVDTQLSSHMAARLGSAGHEAMHVRIRYLPIGGDEWIAYTNIQTGASVCPRCSCQAICFSRTISELVPADWRLLS
jgi:hypothetical protein